MGMPMDLVLVRHGQSETNVAAHASRHGDDSWLEHPEYRERHPSLAHLTDLGVEQAHQAGTWTRHNLGETFDRYYVSAYTRALETAAQLQLPQARWHIDARLREHEYGREAQPTAGERQHQDLVDSARMHSSSPFFARRVGGESMAEVVERVRDMLDTLHRDADGKRVIVVCHGQLMRAFHVALARLTPQAYAGWLTSTEVADRIHNGQVFHYTRRLDPGATPAGELAPHFTGWRSISATDLSLCDPAWRPLHRPVFDNEELLALAAQTPPRIIDGR
jgi:NAD+ kinase